MPVLAAARPLGFSCALFGLIILAGYAGQFERLYRPLSEGPATHSLTALSFVFIGFGLGFGSARLNLAIRILISACVAAPPLFRLLDAVFGTVLAEAITPFSDVVRSEISQGKSNSFGINSAAMLFLISVSVTLIIARLQNLAQAAALVALALPVISVTGYSYGIMHFHGQMSLITALVGILLSVSALMSTARSGALRAMLSPHIGGRVSRLQILLGGTVPYLMGYLVITSVAHGRENTLFAAYVVALSFFMILLISVSAVLQERSDKGRRLAERARELTAEELKRSHDELAVHLEELEVSRSYLEKQAVQMVELAEELDQEKKRAEELSIRDRLTGLYNRLKLDETFIQEMERAKRYGHPLSIILFDIDHFKQVNDVHGHQVGDDVLVAVADLLRGNIRAIDTAGRWGGEEFLVICPETASSGGALLADKIRVAIESHHFPTVGQKTASFGVSTSTSDDDAETLTKRADDALYKAKKGGRNRVEMAP